MLHILTLSWNAKNKLERLYPTIINGLTDIEYKWWIKDNGSIDGSIDLINNWNDNNVVGIQYPHNKDNFSQGCNYLFTNSKAKDEDFILLLNNDMIFSDKTSIKNMLKIIQSNSEIGIVGAKLNYMDRPNVLQHAGVLWHPYGMHTPSNYRSNKLEEIRDRKNRLYPMVTGAILLTRAKIYKDIGGLDEKFFWCWEDISFCLDVIERGYKIVYCGETSILHEESASLKINPVNKLFFHQNTKLFMDRWQSKIDPELMRKYDQDPSFMLYQKN